jgi:hypothetical protein
MPILMLSQLPARPPELAAKYWLLHFRHIVICTF